MKKTYSYDPNRFQSILDRHKIRQVDVQRALGYANSIMVRSWRDGKDIYAERICKICNNFGIDILEFFVPQEEEEEKSYKTDFEKHLEETVVRKEEMESAAREAEMETDSPAGNEQNISVEYLLRKVDEARDKERRLQEDIRRQERREHEKAIDDCRERFNKELMGKSREVLEEQKRANEILLKNKELEMKLELLTRQYKELELSTYKGGSTSGIAENGQYLRK